MTYLVGSGMDHVEGGEMVCREHVLNVFVAMATIMFLSCSAPQESTEPADSENDLEVLEHGELCSTDEECADGLVCSTPLIWNNCGYQPIPVDCGEGFRGDACGACYRVCADDTVCPKGTICIDNGVCAPPPQCLRRSELDPPP